MYYQTMNKAKALHIYCTDETRGKLEQLAEASRRSLSNEVQVLIDQAYENHVKKSRLIQQVK